MEHVWVKGDKCIAKFSGDGNWYEAKIKKLYKNDTGQRVAWLGFEGYSSEEDEEVTISSLKPFKKAKDKNGSPKNPEKASTSALSNKAMFSPLQGNEEKLRLEEKYKLLDQEEEEEMIRNRKWETTKKTLADFPKRQNKPSPKSTLKRKSLTIKGGNDCNERASKGDQTLVVTTKKGDQPTRESVDPKRYLHSLLVRR